MMKDRRYSLGQQCLTYVLLVSLLLQSCYNNQSIPNEPGEGNIVQSHSLMPTNQGEGITNAPVPDSQSNSLLTLQTQEDKGATSQATVLGKNGELGTFIFFPKEVLQLILSYIPAGRIGRMRQTNRAFYRLTTGYDKPGLVGVDNKPTYKINVDSWMISDWLSDNWIDFSNDKRFRKLTPATIPSLLFYQFLEKARSLPSAFWPYLKGTHIKEIDLESNNLSDSKAAELVKSLQGTNVYMVGLSWNKIGASGVQELTKALANSQIHDLNLRGNQIRNSGTQALANTLTSSQIHTLNLSRNQIGDPGVQALAKALPNSQIHMLYLEENQIGNSGAQALGKALPKSKIHTLDLSWNQIGDSGAESLAKELAKTQIHTLDLSENQITSATQKLLREQFPNIQWRF